MVSTNFINSLDLAVREETGKETFEEGEIKNKITRSTLEERGR